MNSHEFINKPHRTSSLKSLSEFSKEHRAAHWSGSFAAFLEGVFPADPRGIDALQPPVHVGHDARADEQRCSTNELFGIDDTIERVVDYFKAAAAGSEVGRRLLLLLGPPSGGKSTLVILLKRGLEEYSHTDAGALYAIHGCPVHESPLHLVPHTLRAQFRETYGVDIAGELCPHCRSRLAAASTAATSCRCRCSACSFRKPAASASAPTRRTTRPPPTSPTWSARSTCPRCREYGDEGDPRAWSWSGAVYRGQPRHARDDRDPQGQARVPLPAADADAGEERQGVALPADLPRRDHRRAHQPGGVPQVPAGAARTRRCSTAW